jgi:hypothetical protein
VRPDIICLASSELIPILFSSGAFEPASFFAPLFLLAVTVAFSALHLESLKLILIFWGTVARRDAGQWLPANL